MLRPQRLAMPSPDLPTPIPPAATRPRRWARAVARGVTLALVGVALVGVFQAYRAPDFVRTLADQVWSCF